jgi:Rad3-related DNA helicase
MNNSLFPMKTIRPVQQEIIDKINKNLDKRYFIIEAGTGIGKSPLAIQACLSDGKGFVITDSIQLQEQYEKDFGHLSLINIKGRANYPCSLRPKFTCEMGPCSADNKILVDCIKNNKCAYHILRQKTLNSSVFLSNYAFFILASNCAEWMVPRNSIVFDEAHLLEKHLTNFCILDKVASEDSTF